MSTNTDLEPSQIIALCVRRWQSEVTFAETRAHLRMETQRQWNDNAILRTTLSLPGLYNLVTVWAGDVRSQATRPHADAWSVPFAWFCEATILIETAVNPEMHITPPAQLAWRRRPASPHNVQSRAKHWE
ncbi:hypothetical protein [Rhizobium sp. P32RR-XVIII]|uniref:hypothetical protein n=1 Tax=Rhizobium sp. P32RR-XVIII TaxID=2726738 RepID=UPI001FEFA8F3|nr:hypothetical protein [Rhizobium sp. P32RR-XVIII]